MLIPGVNSDTVKKILIHAKSWFLKFLQIQLIMSLVSLVILINWGLPISLLSPVGNMVFPPIFTVFLGLASVIFFLEILSIPNGILVYFLEKVTSLWFFLAQNFNNKSLIGFVKPPILFTIIVPVLILFILIYKKINSLNKSIIALTILFFASCAYLKMAYTPSSFVKNIACNRGHVTFIYDNGKTAIIDPGYIGQRLSAPSWVQYTLVQEIIKSSGAMTIDHLIVLQPGKITFDAIKQLSRAITIKNIDLIAFDAGVNNENMKKNMTKSFAELQKEAQERNIKINKIGQTESVINLTDKTKILVTPLPNIIKNNKLTYPAICLTCDTKTIDNKVYKIYSAKHKALLIRQHVLRSLKI
jgi:hypothetical protein